MPGASRIDAWIPSPPGEPMRVVWETLERDAMDCPRVVAGALNRIGKPRHLIWNPNTGEITQMMPAGETIGIGVIARAAHPFTLGPCLGLASIMDWLTKLGIPQAWPAGPPTSPEVPGNRELAIWRSTKGHFGSSQVPHGTGTGPGAIDIRRLFDRAGMDRVGDREAAEHSVAA